MALPTIRAVGAAASGIGAISPGLPAGNAAGDLLVMALETGKQAITVSGWTQAPDSPQEQGAAPPGGSRLTIFYKIAVGSDATTTSDAGNHQLGQIVGITAGTFDAAAPFNVTAGGNQTATASVSIPGDTTTVDDCLILAFCTGDNPDTDTTTQFASWANTDLANVTEQMDVTTSQGNGGALGMASGEKATAGAYGATTATATNPADRGCISLAIAPASAATGTVAVTQADQTSTASGTVLNPITGTVAVTQAAQTSTASAVETFTATSTSTQDAQTSTASGTVANPVTGNVAVTQADQTSTASGAESFTATAGITQADQTSTASAVETFTGTSANTQADQTSTASAVVGDAPSGTVAVTQADQTSTASGTVTLIVSGTVAVTQSDQTSAAFAVETFTGTSANVQADQGSAAVAVLGFSGSSTATQADQTSIANGTALFAVTGTVAVVQADQFSTATGVGGILTFWSPNPVVFTKSPVSHVKAPVAFVKVGAGDDPPW